MDLFSAANIFLKLRDDLPFWQGEDGYFNEFSKFFTFRPEKVSLEL